MLVSKLPADQKSPPKISRRVRRGYTDAKSKKVTRYTDTCRTVPKIKPSLVFFSRNPALSITRQTGCEWRARNIRDLWHGAIPPITAKNNISVISGRSSPITKMAYGVAFNGEWRNTDGALYRLKAGQSKLKKSGRYQNQQWAHMTKKCHDWVMR